MLKAVAGGGGRGMQAVRHEKDLAPALKAVRAEAVAAFGDDRIYAEALIRQARHIEVQVLGDGLSIAHLWERDCSLQRRHQKVLEIAPAPGLDPGHRDQMLTAACHMAAEVNLCGVATFEFLLDPSGTPRFIEANPRIQVEHTVTEMITGIDLVQAQIRLARGETLTDIGLDPARPVAAKGTAIQLRISAERLLPDGGIGPTGGTLTAYAPPGGPAVRVDGCGYVGMKPNPAFDSLLAKLIVHAADGTEPALRKASRALQAFHIEGVETNKPVLAALLGVITPFCSCSAVPAFIGFLAAGIPLGVTMSFLIASPMVNEVAIGLLFNLFGWRITLIYISSGLLIAILAGWVLGRLQVERWVESFG